VAEVAAVSTQPKTAKPVPANRRIVRVNNDHGACRCRKILNTWGGRTTHYIGQCRDLPEPKGGKA
jgi:hypothetical protein